LEKKTKKIQVRCTPSFMKDLLKISRLYKTTKSDLIITVMTEYFESQKKLLKNVLTDIEK
jgi:hypothetical protein